MHAQPYCFLSYKGLKYRSEHDLECEIECKTVVGESF